MKVAVAKGAALAVGIILASGAQAQEGKFYPLDMYACSLKEGVTMKDVDKLDKQFAKWAAENDPGQTAWRMTPQWREDGEIDVAYLATWADGAAMGKGMAAWMDSGSGVGTAYSEKMSCSHSLASSLPINLPADYEPGGGGLVWFGRCTIAEGATWSDAVEAHTALNAKMREMESVALNWMVIPGLGFGDVEFDYYSVVGFSDYDALGQAYDVHFNGGGMREQMSIMSDVASCASPNVYDVKLLVAGE